MDTIVPRHVIKHVRPSLLLLVGLLTACTPAAGPVPTPGMSTPASGDLGAYFDHPPDFPGYQWTYNGRPVDSTHGMNSIAGPAHCDWQTATMMHLPWPLGIDPISAADVRQYVRDPKGVMPRNLHGRLELHATLPADAFPTGYEYGPLKVYLNSSEQDEAVYVVGPGAVERWQRSDPMTLCA